MANAELKGFKVTELSFFNKLNGNIQINLENKYSYNVKYSSNNTCVGEFTAESGDKDNKAEFGIKVVAKGIFTFKENVSKQALHVETYNILFPYIKSLVTTITANAGITPIFIPFVGMENQSIYQIDAKPPIQE